MAATSDDGASRLARPLAGPSGSMIAGAVWQVDLLGGLRLRDGERELTKLPSRAATALLARLALAPTRLHAREELVELLWPGVEADVGRNRLRQVLSTLKAILEPVERVPARAVLQSDRLGIRVLPGTLDCDVARFEQAVRSGQATIARALYRGELLPGHYDEWIDDERLRLSALHDRLADLPDATPSMRTPDAVDGGPRADTAAAVEGAIARPGARVSLPSYLSRLFGAEDQARRVREHVLAHRLVTLIGPGGAGKTRLAVEVAHSLRDHAGWPLPAPDPAEPFDVIAFVSLASCATRQQALDAVTTSLQLAAKGEEPMAALVQALSGRRVLLVLDNFEQLVGEAEDLVAHLAGALPLLHLLVTSRRALGLDGERELGLAALELPRVDGDASEAARNPAVALFVERARGVRSDFHFSERNAATLVALVHALEGMPLAIELAASRVRSIAPADMLARLRGPGTPRLDLLTRGMPRNAADARHASMQRTIAWSWEQLTKAQARLLAAVTVFAGGFTADAAAMLNHDDGDVDVLLGELVAHSLVQARPTDDGESLRFAVYEPIREFARARLDDATAGHWRSRLRAWAIAWARLLPATPPLPSIRAEMPNLVAALATANADGQPADAIHLLLALRDTMEVVELPADALTHAQAAVAACGDPVLQARGRAVLAMPMYIAGRAEPALALAAAAATCDALSGADQAAADYAHARVLWRLHRQPDEVRPSLDRADALAAAGDDDMLKGGLLALRGFVESAARNGHDSPAGDALHQQALALWQRAGNRHAVNSGRYNLAVAAQNANRHAEAMRLLDPVIASARAEQDLRRLSMALNVLGNAQSGLRLWPQAIESFRECIRVAWDCMVPFDLAYGLWNLPRALAHVRQPEPAIRLLAFALAYWRRHFGEIHAHDQRYLVRLRRLASRQIDAARIDALWRDGEELSLPQAVALALQPR